MKITRCRSLCVSALLLAGLFTGCDMAPPPTDHDASSTVSDSSISQDGSGNLSGIPDLINLDAPLPIVKDGQNIPMQIVIARHPLAGDAEDLYWTHFMRERMNIDAEIVQVPYDELHEYLKMSFVSGTYPEVLLGMQMNPQRQVSYGVVEGHLLPLDPYITETLMPNLTRIYEERPDFRALATAPDGNIYSFGCFLDPIESAGMIKSASINIEWLEEHDLVLPRTLDEHIDMLRTFKQRRENVLPVGGSVSLYHPGAMILNALGYITEDAEGLTPAIREGRVVIPAGDRELYGEYLNIMKLLYSEGLISPDFYTMDDLTVHAMIAEGRSGYVAHSGMYGIFPDYEDYAKWQVTYPLTSRWNDTPLAMKWQELTTGGMVITDACRNPEAAARFADYFFTAQGAWHAWAGPTVGTDQMMEGWGGGYIDEEYKTRMVDMDENPGQYASVFDYLVKRVSITGASVIGDRREESAYKYPVNGLSVTTLSDTYRPEVPDNYYRIYVLERVAPCAREGYPSLTYFTEEEFVRITDLRSALEVHMRQESAKFVTGVRSLDELNEYFHELDSLGFQEYLGIYAACYESYQDKLR